MIRAHIRRKTHDSPSPILSQSLEVPQYEYWCFEDFREWTGAGSKDIVQAMVFGLCRTKNAAIIEKILAAGGLEVKPGRKKPLP